MSAHQVCKPHHAVIQIERNAPGGVYDSEWLGYDTACRGCGSWCGSAGHLENDLDADRFIVKQKEKLRTCESSKGSLIIEVMDCRKRQASLLEFSSGNK